MDQDTVFKRQVVLLMEPGANAWWRKSILQRSDLNVIPVSSVPTAMTILGKGPCALLIAEERPAFDLAGFIDQFKRTFTQPSFPFLVLSRALPPGPGEPPITKVLPSPCHLETFNQAVAEALGIPPRSHRRYLMRVQVGAHSEGGPATTALASTVEISVNGMRVETSAPLVTGQRYTWGFAGIKVLSSLQLSGIVLRQEEQPAKGLLRHYAVQFEMGPEEAETLNRFLIAGF